MKRFFFFFAAALLTLCPAGAQVRFDADFESGSLGKVTLLDSAWVVVSPGDTVLHLSYLLDGHFEPANPIDTSLALSANW